MNIFSLMALIVSQIIIFGRNIIMFSCLNTVTGFFTFNFHTGNLVDAWPFLLVPQAWTLPIELSFYLLAPFLVRKKLYFIGIVFILTLIVKSVLVRNGLTNTMWTYRFFPAELSYFILGIFSYKLYAVLKPTVVVKRIGFFAALLMIALLCVFNYGTKYLSLSIFTIEWIYYILIMLLLPFGFIYSKKLIFDRKIGELSYPIYISHVLVNNIANPLLITRYAPEGNFSAIIVLLLSVIFSVIMLKFIQNPIEKIRAKSAI
jgi:peptidoglycan/LPS O-acetylase OafA/YrhL